MTVGDVIAWLFAALLAACVLWVLKKVFQ